MANAQPRPGESKTCHGGGGVDALPCLQISAEACRQTGKNCAKRLFGKGPGNIICPSGNKAFQGVAQNIKAPIGNQRFRQRGNQITIQDRHVRA